jgi:hypothetical protein
MRDPSELYEPGGDPAVERWAEEMWDAFVEPLPAEVACHHVGLAAEAARLSTGPERGRAGLSRWVHVPARVLARAAGVIIAFVVAAGGVATAAGVDVTDLITKPFGHGHKPGAGAPPNPEEPATTFITTTVSTTTLVVTTSTTPTPDAADDAADQAGDAADDAADQAGDAADDAADQAGDAADDAADQAEGGD